MLSLKGDAVGVTLCQFYGIEGDPCLCIVLQHCCAGSLIYQYGTCVCISDGDVQGVPDHAVSVVVFAYEFHVLDGVVIVHIKALGDGSFVVGDVVIEVLSG